MIALRRRSVVAVNEDQVMIEPEEIAAPAKLPLLPKRMFWLGVTLTLAVLAGTALYLWIKAGRPLTASEPAPGSISELVLRISVADLGQLVSGIAGLLAFLWIILAYLQQSTQLRLQRDELVLQRHELALQRQETKRLADEAREQVEVLRQTGAVARREAFIRLLDLYERKLVLEASQISSMTASDPDSSENHQNAWREYERGDRNALFRNLIRQLVRGQHKEFLRRVDHVMSGRAFLERFSSTVAEVLKEAASIDDKMEALCRSSEWAFLAELLDRARATVPPEAFSPQA